MTKHIEDRYRKPKNTNEILYNNIQKQKDSTKKRIKKALNMVNLFAEQYTKLQNMHKEIQKYMIEFEDIYDQFERDFKYMQQKVENECIQHSFIIENKNMINAFMQQLYLYEEIFQKKADEIRSLSEVLYNIDYIDDPQYTIDTMNTFIVHLLCDADTLLENWNIFYQDIQKKISFEVK